MLYSILHPKFRQIVEFIFNICSFFSLKKQAIAVIFPDYLKSFSFFITIGFKSQVKWRSSLDCFVILKPLN